MSFHSTNFRRTNGQESNVSWITSSLSPPLNGAKLPQLRMAANRDMEYGRLFRKYGLDTVIRYFGLDVEVHGLGLGARREVTDLRQGDTSCAGDARHQATQHISTDCPTRPQRCCSCVGGRTLTEHTRSGWAAQGKRACECDEAFRLRVPGVTFSGYLNCGRDAPPYLERLMKLDGASPFEGDFPNEVDVEAWCPERSNTTRR